MKSQDELLGSLLTLLKSGVEGHMHAASVALGHCHPDHLPVLQPVRRPSSNLHPNEKIVLGDFEIRFWVQQLLEMYADTLGDAPTRKATRLVRREDMRLYLAHVYRCTAQGLPPDQLLYNRAVAHQYCKFLALALQVRMHAYMPLRALMRR